VGRNADSEWYCPGRNIQVEMGDSRTREKDECDSYSRSISVGSEERTQIIVRDRESSQVVIVGVLSLIFFMLNKKVFLEKIIRQIIRSRPSSRAS
jgi:hypothetical protein